MSTYKSYVDRFTRSKSTKRDASSDLKLTTDKEAYTQFLEIQLERISQAILHVDTFNEKLETVCAQVNSLEEKVNNSNKLVKLLQSFADGQEEDNTKMQEKIADVLKKSSDFANLAERRYAKIEDLESITQRLKDLEKKNGHHSHHEHDTNERFTTAATDHLSTLFNERERGGQGKDFEQRIIEQVNQRIDHYISSVRNFEDKIEDYNEKFSRDIATDIRTLENRMSEFIDRAEGRRGGFHGSDFDGIKEELYQKIEIFMDELKNTASMVDLEEIKASLDKESQERKEAIEKIEEYIYINDKRSSTLREDLNHKIEDLEVVIKRGTFNRDEEGENSSFPEQKFSEELHKLQRTVRDLNAKIGHSSSDNYRSGSGSVGSSSRNAMDELEKRIADNMVDGFDRFSNILKKHMEKTKKIESKVQELNERVTTLEDNVPSRSRSQSQTKGNLKKLSSTKYQSHNIYLDDQDQKDLLSTKENPFLKGRLASASKISSRNMEAEGQASFGKKSKRFPPFDLSESLLDEEDTKLNGQKKKKISRSRSRSASKSLSSSFISNNGKEVKSPGIRRNYESNRIGSNSKKNRRSPSASASATPKGRDSIRSHESFGSRRSVKRGVLENSNKKSNIKQMQNKIEMERKLREEKIKKLIKKTKPTSDTPKFSGKEPGSKQNKENNANSKSLKSTQKTATPNDTFDRNLKFDYNFTAKPEKQIGSSRKESKKYQKLDELYNKNASRKYE